MTASDIVQRRLRNQRLVGTGFRRPEEVVKWLLAAQAQDFHGAKWSIGARLAAASDNEVERAFDEGAILRTHLLRPTWHFVAPDDIGWLLALTAPHVQAKSRNIYRKLGLAGGQLDRSKDLFAEALEGGRYLTRDELREVLRRGGLDAQGQLRLPYFLMNAELEGLVCSGPRRGKSFTYALLQERAPGARRLERGEALAELAGRYFRSRGPATVHDFAKWSGLAVREARMGMQAVANELEQRSMDGRTYWFPPGDPPPPSLAPAAHLLSIYDEYVSGYKDRSAILEPGYWDRLMRMGSALTQIVILNGQVVGSWKRSLSRKRVSIRLDLFTRLAGAELRAVEEAAERYASFLGLEPELATEVRQS